MLYDTDLLSGLESGMQPPTVRFFEFKTPTVSYGRLQKIQEVMKILPSGWDVVQRPTGGGIVFHQGDLCFSLGWSEGQAPLPAVLKDVYRWIHEQVQTALAPWMALEMASCKTCQTPTTGFEDRQCFQAPVVFDLMKDHQKIVGGAMARRKKAFLYQGSIQWKGPSEAFTAVTQRLTRELGVSA